MTAVDGRGAPDGPRLLDLRHDHRLRPRPREHAADAARRRSRRSRTSRCGRRSARSLATTFITLLPVARAVLLRRRDAEGLRVRAPDRHRLGAVSTIFIAAPFLAVLHGARARVRAPQGRGRRERPSRRRGGEEPARPQSRSRSPLRRRVGDGDGSRRRPPPRPRRRRRSGCRESARVAGTGRSAIAAASATLRERASAWRWPRRRRRADRASESTSSPTSSRARPASGRDEARALIERAGRPLARRGGPDRRARRRRLRRRSSRSSASSRATSSRSWSFGSPSWSTACGCSKAGAARGDGDRGRRNRLAAVTLSPMATGATPQSRAAVRDRAGRGPARLRLLLRAGTGSTDLIPAVAATRAVADAAASQRGRSLREMLDELGPTFVKFGQLLSMRPDVAPAGHHRRAARPPGRRAPVPVTRRSSSRSRRSSGQPIERLFLEFEPEPMAAASIGQVHRAVLPNGRRVAVKVQRPGAPRGRSRPTSRCSTRPRGSPRSACARSTSSTRASSSTSSRARSARSSTTGSRRRNAEAFRRNFAGHPHVRIPRVYWSYTRTRVLTLEFLEGHRSSPTSIELEFTIDERAAARRT